MIIEIDEGLKKYYSINFDKIAEGILNKIPKEYLIKLDKVQIVYNSPEKYNKKAYGFYYGEREGEKKPKVVICVGNIFEYVPKVFLRLSVIPTLFLAKTICHEVAHHYQRLHHGIGKEKWEKNATEYTKKMLRKNFGIQLFLVKLLFSPLFFLTSGRFRQKNSGKRDSGTFPK